MPYWKSLEQQLQLNVRSSRCQEAFSAWRSARPVLGYFRTGPMLIGALRQRVYDDEVVLAVLLDLMHTMRHGPKPDVARDLLIYALWPGLNAAYSDLRKRGAGRYTELASTMMVAVLEVLRTAADRPAEHPAAAVVRSTKYVAWRLLARQRRQLMGRAVEVDENRICAPLSPEAERSALCEEVNARAHLDQELIVRTVQLGQSYAEAGASVGLTAAAAKKRMQRLRRRMSRAA